MNQLKKMRIELKEENKKIQLIERKLKELKTKAEFTRYWKEENKLLVMYEMQREMELIKHLPVEEQKEYWELKNKINVGE